MRKTNERLLLEIWLTILLSIGIAFGVKSCVECRKIWDKPEATTYQVMYLDDERILIPID